MGGGGSQRAIRSQSTSVLQRNVFVGGTLFLPADGLVTLGNDGTIAALRDYTAVRFHRAGKLSSPLYLVNLRLAGEGGQVGQR